MLTKYVSNFAQDDRVAGDAGKGKNKATAEADSSAALRNDNKGCGMTTKNGPDARTAQLSFADS